MISIQFNELWQDRNPLKNAPPLGVRRGSTDRLPGYMVAIEQQIWRDGMHQSQNPNYTTSHHTQASIETFVQNRPHPSAGQSRLKSNKWMRKPDWHSQQLDYCNYTFSLLLALRQDHPPDNLIPKGSGTLRGTRPSRPVRRLSQLYQVLVVIY